ncbi:MAG: histidine--tRNA ligase, partial [Stutzerimonas stutzeri]
NRKVLDGVMEAIGLGGEDNAGRRLNVLRAIDKLDKFGPEGVKLLLGPGRKDESGDFTKGAGLDAEDITLLIGFLKSTVSIGSHQIAYENSDQSVNTKLMPHAMFPYDGNRLISNERFSEGIAELSTIRSIIHSAGYGPDRIKIDPSVVRGLEYYTGPVYEAELTFDVTNEKGEKVVFGSVGGGGRYDGLVSRFMGQPVPATGFSIGVSRLMTALKNLGKLGQVKPLAPVLITVMDGDVESMGRYQRFTQALRAEGIRAEMYQGNWKKFGNQLKYADRLGSPIAIIQGGDERAEGVVQIKDLIEGKRLSGEIEDNASWREARVAQVSVPEADLVAKVREILEHQAEDVRRAAEGR